MVFSDENNVLIKNLCVLKGYRPMKLIREFPQKNWKKRGLDKLLKQIQETGTADWKGSGGPRSASTQENVSAVEELDLSQKGQPQTASGIFQHALRISFEERKNETSDEATQHTSETVPPLKFPTGKHRYLASVLTGVILFVQVLSGIEAILLVLHVDASNDK